MPRLRWGVRTGLCRMEIKGFRLRLGGSVGKCRFVVFLK